jgi:cell division protein ZapA
MKQVEITIMSQNYVLQCPEDGEALLRQAVAKVDAAMCKIRDAGKIKARERIAVLAALNLAFELPSPEANPTIANDDRSPTTTSTAGLDAPLFEGGNSSPHDLQTLLQKIDQSLSDDQLI